MVDYHLRHRLPSLPLGIVEKIRCLCYNIHMDNEYDQWREEQRRAHLEDGAGFTVERAQETVSGIRHVLGGEALTKTTHHERRHYSHRGGRAFPESEHDPFWEDDSSDATPEQREQAIQQIEEMHAADLQRKIDKVNNSFIDDEEKRRQINYILAKDRAGHEIHARNQ